MMAFGQIGSMGETKQIQMVIWLRFVDPTWVNVQFF